MSVNKKKSSSSSSSSSSSEGKPKTFYQSTIPAQPLIQQHISVQPQRPVVYQSGIAQQGLVQTSQMQTLTTLPVGITEEQIRRSLAGVSMDTIKGEVRSEYIPLTRVETEYKEELQYEQIPRQVKVTDYYQVEILQEHVPSVLQHTITEYVPQQKIIPQVNYKAIEKTYTRPEIIAGDVRIEQGAMEIVSSQIIQTESQAHTVAYPQIATQGTTYVQSPQMAQYSTMNVIQGKRKSSSIKYTTTQIVQPQVQMGMSPSRIQMAQPMRQLQAMPMQQMTMQPMQMQAMPMQQMTMQPMQMQRQTQVQTFPTQSIQYTTQPMQTIATPVGFQQNQMFPQQISQPMFMNQAPGITGMPMTGMPGMPMTGMPGMPMNNFQGVRLADSHILMK